MKRSRLTIGIGLLSVALLVPASARGISIRRSLPRSCAVVTEAHSIKFTTKPFPPPALAVADKCTFRYQGGGVRIAGAANASGWHAACGGFGGCSSYWAPYDVALAATISWNSPSGAVWLARCTVNSWPFAYCIDNGTNADVPLGAMLTCAVTAYAEYANELFANAFCSNFDAGTLIDT